MSYAEHKQKSKDTPVTCAVLTVSDTRTPDTDASGALLRKRLGDAGHEVTHYAIVPDDAGAIRAQLAAWGGEVEVVVTTGGTGIARRDTTVEVAEALFEKTIPGFGELFRMLSFEEIGAGAMLSRAAAGVYGDAPTLLFCCPGSRNAVALAADRLIVPELRHLVWEIVRQQTSGG
ncbi:MAG: MogA/MoaB family molybdenum cofactor biosynthesis protein [Bacteroidota bacterium]